jgi:hypothetical protein
MLGRLWLTGLVQDAKIFYCPSETAPAQAFNTSLNPWPPKPGATTQGGYACNPLVDWGTTAPTQMPRLLGLTGSPLLADACGLPDRVDSRLRDGINVLFANGSARWIAREIFNAPLSQCSGLSAANNSAQDQVWARLTAQ